MHPRLFRLIEAHQHIDEALRHARQRADHVEVDRLRGLKVKVKRLINHAVATALPGLAHGRA